MQITKAMQICHKNKLIVSPVGEFISPTLYVFYITVNGKKIPIKDPKKIQVRVKQKDAFKELNEALKKTYIFYAKKLCNSK